MIHRRTLMLGIAATGLVAACADPPPGPAVVTIALTAEPGMNPAPDGGDRPVTVSILRLRDVGAFNAADFFALQNDPAAALAADLVGMDQLALAPGGAASKAVTFEPDAAFLGLLALVRDPGGRVWRLASPVAPGAVIAANVTLGPGGMALALA